MCAKYTKNVHAADSGFKLSLSNSNKVRSRRCRNMRRRPIWDARTQGCLAVATLRSPHQDTAALL